MTTTARIAAFSVATLLLLVPAIWNGFPLLFYDTGAYLGRAFSDTLSPGRSAVYGFFLGAGRSPDFWPVVFVQSLVTAWVAALCLRVHGLGDRPLLLPALFALFTVATGLPWLTGQLMPDVFAGLAVLALYLLAFHAEDLSRFEHWLLIGLIAFSTASHNATLAVLVVLLGTGTIVHFLRPKLVARPALARVAMAVGLSVFMLLTANFAVTGRIAWTPGGSAFVFSRLVHDGIVHRFLEDNCPDPRYELCKYRAHLPYHANDFLWHQGPDGPFALIGGFEKGGEEMRDITLQSLWQYPGLHLMKAVQATFDQLLAVGTGWGINYDVWDAYGHIEQLTPEAVPAAHAAKQRLNALHFETINLLHKPVAWFSMAVLALILAASWRWRIFTPLTQFAATVGLALLANAFVCGVFSNAHDRYGARMVWIATFFIAVAVAQLLPTRKTIQPATIPLDTGVPAAAATPEVVPNEVPARPQQRLPLE